MGVWTHAAALAAVLYGWTVGDPLSASGVAVALFMLAALLKVKGRELFKAARLARHKNSSFAVSGRSAEAEPATAVRT